MEMYTVFSAVFSTGSFTGRMDGPMEQYLSENVSEQGWNSLDVYTIVLVSLSLDTSSRKLFTGYLKENMMQALWPLVLEEHGEDKEYFDLLIDIGCITAENVNGLIESMGDHYTQMKGYLIRFKGESGGGDFFGDLDL